MRYYIFTRNNLGLQCKKIFSDIKTGLFIAVTCSSECVENVYVEQKINAKILSKC